MGMFTQVGVDRPTCRPARRRTSASCAALFVMGLGMGGTMMPIIHRGAGHPEDHEIARGSTLMNITQQVVGLDRHGAVLGAADQRLLSRDASSLALAGTDKGKIADVLQKFGLTPDQIPGIATPARILADFGEAFGSVFLIGTILVGLCFIPALFLPRHKVAPLDPAAMVH
jgi:hypothetical protein